MLTIILIIMCNNIKCKYCSSTKINKSGKQNNKQRYLCRRCKRTFIMEEDNRYKLDKYDINKRKMAITMYINNVGIRSIERILNVSNVLILNWIKNISKNIESIINYNNNSNNNSNSNNYNKEITEMEKDRNIDKNKEDKEKDIERDIKKDKDKKEKYKRKDKIINILEIDELYSYVKKNKTKLKYGLLLIEKETGEIEKVMLNLE